MNRIHKEIVVKLKSQPRWIVRLFISLWVVLGGIFAFVSHPIGWTNALNTDGTSEFMHYATVDWVGTISICDPDSNGTKCITMQDKNLWASEAWTWTASYWYHFQRWNNHGFEIGCRTNWCSDEVTANATWIKAVWLPEYLSLWYYGTSFIKASNNYWMDEDPHNLLWWWSWDSQNNNWWYNETWNFAIGVTWRQWPCDTWYHVPSVWEWIKVLWYWAEHYTWQWGSLELANIMSFSWNNVAAKTQFQNDFKIPFAGFHSHTDATLSNFDKAFIWASSSQGSVLFFFSLWFSNDKAGVRRGFPASYGFSVRCFKDSYLEFPSSENGCPEWQELATWDVCIYNDKDIVIQATATANNQSIRINNYFGNSFTVDWWDGNSKQTISTNITHRYTTSWTYNIILSLTWWAERWTFKSTSSPLIPKANATVTWVKITYMPPLSDGFGNSATWAWDYFFSSFNQNWAITSLPEWSFDTSNLESVWSNFFSYFNQSWLLSRLPIWSFNLSNIETSNVSFFTNFNYNWAITYLPNSFTMSSVWSTKYNGYKNAFNSPNYTINRDVSDLVADISTPTSDMDTFSDNQPWRCGVAQNWLVNLATGCPSTITITALPVSYWTVDSGSILADYLETITESWNTLIIWNIIVTATPSNWDYIFSGWDNSCGDVLLEDCTILAMFNSVTAGQYYTITFNSNWWNYTP